MRSLYGVTVIDNLVVVKEKIDGLRKVIEDAEKNNQFQISIEDLLGFLACLERLFILEKHLINLVSSAYEEEPQEEEDSNVTNV